MEKVQSTVCVLLFALVAIAHLGEASSWGRRYFERPGCPNVNSIENCRYLRVCRRDRDCPKFNKCCRSRCGNVCVEQESEESSEETFPPGDFFPPGPPIVAAKPGECPALNRFDRFFRCTHGCFSDFQCKGDDKCCPTPRCGRQCQQPVLPREGECPVPVKRSRACSFPAVDCEHDSQCPQPLKCCDFGCGNKCVPPREDKPGSCPSRCPRFLYGKCPNECLHDGCCLNNQKCCVYGCASICVPPSRPFW